MKIRNISIAIISIIITGIALFLVHQISYDAQNIPPKQTRSDWRKQQKKVHWKNMVEERVEFAVQYSKNSKQRIVRKGILIRKPKSRAVILICHGFMCDKDDVRFLRTLFKDYTTLSFDFRAHGECIAGQYCTLGSREMYDVIGAVDFIKSQPGLKDLPLIVYGFSMGAVSSIMAQAEMGNLFDAAIWDCPFDSTDKIIERSIERLKINVSGYEFNLPGRSILKKYAYNAYVQEILKAALKTVAKMDATAINTSIEPVDTVNAAKNISIPTLFITCKNDTKAPVEAVSAVYENVTGYKRLWLTHGRYHFDSYFYNPEKYRYRVKTFISQFLDGKLAKDPHKSGIWDDSPQDDVDLESLLQDEAL